MSFLSWNCRGLGNPRAVRDLHQLVKEKRPNLVFLMETKLHNKNVDLIRIKLKFDHMFMVDSVGKSGGLMLLWNDTIEVAIQNYSRRHINAQIKVGKNKGEWKFSGFYGHPEAAKRKESWALLRHLATFDPLPWLCIGDFNEIINLAEMKGGAKRAQRQMTEFQEALEDSQLCDLGYKGPKYTWNNGREGGAFTKERLDRATANTEWRLMYPDMEVMVLAKRSSDHHPILVCLNEKRMLVWREKKKIQNGGKLVCARRLQTSSTCGLDSKK
jgi:exonuclease III